MRVFVPLASSNQSHFSGQACLVCTQAGRSSAGSTQTQQTGLTAYATSSGAVRSSDITPNGGLQSRTQSVGSGPTEGARQAHPDHNKVQASALLTHAHQQYAEGRWADVLSICERVRCDCRQTCAQDGSRPDHALAWPGARRVASMPHHAHRRPTLCQPRCTCTRATVLSGEHMRRWPHSCQTAPTTSC